MAKRITSDMKAHARRRPGPVVRAKLRRMDENRAKEWNSFLANDNDSDYGDILEVLRFKLERVRAHIDTQKLVKDAARISKEMKKVISLLDKVIADEYEERRTQRLFRKHGIKRKFGVNAKGVIQTGIPEEISREWMSEMDAAFDERKADLKLAFDLMAENIWTWWE